jgi:Predicted molecular chaperone distantly related to HSP70-fold metalloproteases
MSGTSLDGVDAALVSVDLRGPADISLEILSALTIPLPDALRDEIASIIAEGSASLMSLALLDMRIASVFAEAALAAVAAAKKQPAEVFAIGSHGQTIWHVANPTDYCGEKLRSSFQLGDGSRIAILTGIPTVSDFRTADIAAGGTGAPLVPFFDRIASGPFPKPLVFQNFGGIGNITYLGKDGRLLAFDTGPANMIADELSRIATDGKLRYDRDGELGSRGTVRDDLVARWLQHPFLAMSPPKSSGREEFGAVFIRAEIQPLIAAAPAADRPSLLYDLIRTAERFSAAAAARAYADFLPQKPELAIVSGGGARNPHIMADLAALAPGTRVVSGDVVGVSVDFKEAEAFALMGLYSRLGLACTEPSATGASRPVVAGKLSLP